MMIIHIAILLTLHIQLKASRQLDSNHQCPESAPFYIDELKLCVKECNNKFNYAYKSSCYQKCPVNTTPYKSPDIHQCYKVLSPKDLVAEFNAIANEDEQIMFRYHYYTTWTNDKYTFHIANSIDISSNSSQSLMISRINCNNLYSVYNPQDRHEFIIIQRQWTDATKPLTQVDHRLYTIIGKELDIGKCNYYQLQIPFDRSRQYDTNDIEEIRELYTLGIDPFNLKHKFYTNIAFPIPLNIPYDMSLKDRYEYYYKGYQSRLCPRNLTLKDIDYDRNMTTCEQDTSKPVIFKDIDSIWIIGNYPLRVFKAIGNDTHYLLLIFIPLGCVFILMIIAYILVGCYIVKERMILVLKPVENGIEYQVAEPSNLDNDKKNIGLSKNSTSSQKNVPIGSLKSPKTDDITIENDKQDESDEKSIEKYINMSFAKVLERDFSSFMQKYQGFARITHPIIGLIFLNTKLTSRRFYIYFYLSALIIDFVTIGIGFSVEDLSAIFTNKGKLPCKNTIHILMIACLCSIIAMAFTRAFFNCVLTYKTEVKQLARRNDNDIKAANKEYNIKVHVYPIVLVFSMIIASYFPLIFNAVFTRTRVHYIILLGYLQVIHCLLPFIVSIVYACLMTITIKCKWNTMYFFIKNIIKMYII